MGIGSRLAPFLDKSETRERTFPGLARNTRVLNRQKMQGEESANFWPVQGGFQVCFYGKEDASAREACDATEAGRR